MYIVRIATVCGSSRSGAFWPVPGTGAADAPPCGPDENGG